MARTKMSAHKSGRGVGRLTLAGVMASSRAAKVPRPGSGRAAPAMGTVKKPHRYRSGTVALREIEWYQRECGDRTSRKGSDGKKGKKLKRPSYRLPRASFGRLVREVMQDADTTGKIGRVSPGALEILRTAAEEFTTNMFREVQVIAASDVYVHSNSAGKEVRRGGATPTVRDLDAWVILRGADTPALSGMKPAAEKRFGIVYGSRRKHKRPSRIAQSEKAPAVAAVSADPVATATVEDEERVTL
jgi:histone H3/H4